MNIYMWICLVGIVVFVSGWFACRKERRLSKVKELSAKDASDLSRLVNSSVKKIENKIYNAIKCAALEGKNYINISAPNATYEKYDLVVHHLEEKGYKAKWFYDADLNDHLFSIEWEL